MDFVFPQLLRLPHVALKHVFKFWDYKEVIYFAFCSKNAKKIAKTARDKSRKLEIKVCYSKESRYIISSDNWKFLFYISTNNDEECSTLKVGSEIIPYKHVERYDEKVMLTYFEDYFHGIKFLLSYLTGLFDCGIYDLWVGNNARPDDPWNLIEWVMNRQNSIERVGFKFDYSHPVAENIKHFLKTYKVTELLSLDLFPSNDLQHIFPVDIDWIVVHRGSWITLDNLFAMNSRQICIGNTANRATNLTNNDLNTFLRCWMNGDMPRLRRVDITIKNRDLAVITNGFDVTNVNSEQDGWYYHLPYRCLEFNQHAQLTNKNGVTASILTRLKEFVLLVWPDSHGRTSAEEPKPKPKPLLF